MPLIICLISILGIRSQQWQAAPLRRADAVEILSMAKLPKVKFSSQAIESGVEDWMVGDVLTFLERLELPFLTVTAHPRSSRASHSSCAGDVQGLLR